MPQALRLIVASLTGDADNIKKTLDTVKYYVKSYAKSYRSFSERRKRFQAA
jgi:hypothetical protein